mgnify:CR=1 FL=1
MKRSDLNRLRRLVAWVRCEIGQDPAEMQNMMIGVADSLGHPPIDDGAKHRLVEAYRRSASVPQYVRDDIEKLGRYVRQQDQAAKDARQSAMCDDGSECAEPFYPCANGYSMRPVALEAEAGAEPKRLAGVQTPDGGGDEDPVWACCRIGFDGGQIDPEAIWSAWDKGALAVPEGWRLCLTDGSSGRLVIFFSVDSVPGKEDAKAVRAVIDAFAQAEHAHPI